MQRLFLLVMDHVAHRLQNSLSRHPEVDQLKQNKSGRGHAPAVSHQRGHAPFLTCSVLCAFCAFLWLSAELHAWLRVFLEEVSDVDSEAFQLLI